MCEGWQSSVALQAWWESSMRPCGCSWWLEALKLPQTEKPAEGFRVYRPRCQVVGDRRRWLGAPMGRMRTSCVKRSICLFSYGGTAVCSSHREGAWVNPRAVGVPERGTSCPSLLPSPLWGWSLCWCFIGAFGSRVSGRCGFLPSTDGHQPSGDPGRGKSCAETGVGRDVHAAGAGCGGNKAYRVRG